MTHAPVTALPTIYDLVAWISAKIGAFPRSHRFTVGDRLMTSLLEMLDRFSAV